MEPTSVTPAPIQVGDSENMKLDAQQTDVAAVYLNNAEHYEPLSPEDEKKLMRKTDWILLPMVSCTS